MRVTLINYVFKWFTFAFMAGLIMSGAVMAENQDAGSKININAATVKELAKLPGIGKKKAEAIVAYREQHGPYKNIEELVNVKGIGTATIDTNKSKLTVE